MLLDYTIHLGMLLYELDCIVSIQETAVDI